MASGSLGRLMFRDPWKVLAVFLKQLVCHVLTWHTRHMPAVSDPDLMGSRLGFWGLPVGGAAPPGPAASPCALTAGSGRTAFKDQDQNRAHCPIPRNHFLTGSVQVYSCLQWEDKPELEVGTHRGLACPTQDQLVPRPGGNSN